MKATHCALALALTGAAVSCAHAAAVGETRRFALVVAENRPFDTKMTALQYADDDALRYAELYRGWGAQVELLTVLDDDTQRRYPGVASSLVPATRVAMVEAMQRLNADMVKAKAQGARVDFHFVFAGHGEEGENAEGRMHLRDGALSRTDLLDWVVAGSRADFNHLIVDACNAQSLVFSRGGRDDGYRAEDYGTAIRTWLDRHDLRAYPNTGALLAASSGRDSHEWSAFGAGVFSHEVRSALLGPADINGDGSVEYSEVAAYVHAANQAIPDARARPRVVVHPPEMDRNRPLVQLADGPRSFLRLPPGFAGRAWLEDARGNRYADFNPSGERPVFVTLAESPYYYLRRPDVEARVVPPRPGVVDEGGLVWRRRDMQGRGALEDAFARHLFEQPFGPGFYAGYVTSAGMVPARTQGAGAWTESLRVETESLALRERLPWVAGGLSAAAAVGATWLGLSARADLDTFERGLARDGLDDPALRRSIDGEARWAWGLGAGAVTLAGAAVALWLWEPSVDQATPAGAIESGPGRVGFAF